MAKKIICVGSLGDYRREVVVNILRMTDSDFLIISGDRPIEPTVRLLDLDDPRLKRVRNVFLFKRRATFQVGSFIKCLLAKGLILDLNPRSVSVWMLLVLRRIFWRRTAVWGHAWPRKGAGAASDVLRGMLRKLSGTVIVYTQSQAKELLHKEPKLRVIAAPNAIYSLSEMRSLPPSRKGGLDILYVGRLVSEKKPSLLLRAFVEGCHALPEETNLIFVGEGPEASELKAIAGASHCANRICFKGHVSDPAALASLYSESLFSVSPGYVGLSITQSFGFGTPMLISRDERHSPEIEAAIDGVNSRFFESDNVNHLVYMMHMFFAESGVWIARREEISASCAASYSAENMAMKILSAL